MSEKILDISGKEFDIIHCKSCGKECKRYNMGKYPSGRDTKYADDTGRLVNGLRCASCHKDKMKLNKRLQASLIKQTKDLLNEDSTDKS